MYVDAYARRTNRKLHNPTHATRRQFSATTTFHSLSALCSCSVLLVTLRFAASHHDRSWTLRPPAFRLVSRPCGTREASQSVANGSNRENVPFNTTIKQLCKQTTKEETVPLCASAAAAAIPRVAVARACHSSLIIAGINGRYNGNRI